MTNRPGPTSPVAPDRRLDKPILLCGAGIGGLVAGLCLHRAGLPFVLAEASERIAADNAGVQLGPNAMRILARLDLGDTLRGIADYPDRIELREGRGGGRSVVIPLGAAAEARWGAPYALFHRADLVRTLAETLCQRAPGALQLGQRAIACGSSSRQAWVDFAGGRRIATPLLIDASGRGSPIRQWVAGRERTARARFAAWRAVLPRAGAASVLPSHPCIWAGRGRHAVTYALRQGKELAIVAVLPIRNSGRRAGMSGAEASAALAGWDSRLLRAMAPGRFLPAAIVDAGPSERWHLGRVALLGDACHAFPPHVAQGAAMAVEDSWALATTLASRENVDAALERYRALRAPRILAVAGRARRFGRLYRLGGPQGRLVRGAIAALFDLVPGLAMSRLDHLYGAAAAPDGG